MQNITKEEFSTNSDYSDLIVLTNENKYNFEEGSYTFKNDTIYGRGKSVLINPIEYKSEPFEGGISLRDIEEMLPVETPDKTKQQKLIVKTKDKEYFFTSEGSSYYALNDTLFGKGEQKKRVKGEEMFDGKISLNDAEIIKIDKINLLSSVLVGGILVLLIVGIIHLSTSDLRFWPKK